MSDEDDAEALRRFTEGQALGEIAAALGFKGNQEALVAVRRAIGRRHGLRIRTTVVTKELVDEEIARLEKELGDLQ